MDIINKNIARIPFNLPTCQQEEIAYVLEALKSNHRHGAGAFTERATAQLKAITGANKVLLTHSCTAALELAMLLLEIGEGDEVILPSFTFSSTANAVVLRGAVPVFADIDPHTQNLDPAKISELITSKTRAILPVHYAGVGCDIEAICALAEAKGLAVVEDAAQAVGSTRNGTSLGLFGALGAFSFHDSKNISSGEGGALLVNNEFLMKRAEILWEKGTNRSQFIRGEVDKYTWVDVGSSFLPSEVTTAFLLGQLEKAEQINSARRQVWSNYYHAFAESEALGLCARPFVPPECVHNGHIFYLILQSTEARNDLLAYMKSQGIGATFHYVPLHSSVAGKRFGRTPLPMPNTDRAGHCLLRLPLFPDMTSSQQEKVISAVNEFFSRQVQKKIG